MQVVNFRQMKDGTKEEYHFLEGLEDEFQKQLPDRIMKELADLEEGLTGYRVNRLEHSLISATMAEADGADLDWIVAALVHDIGDGLAPKNHDSIASAIIAPYVREECTWVLKTHGIFQMVYYAHHFDDDPYARDKYKDHPLYQKAIDFCEFWDQSAFDPDFEYKPLEYWRPMVEEVFSRKAWDPAILQSGVEMPLRAAA